VADAPTLTEEEFRRLCEFLYRRTGMVFTETKRYFVERRVIERMSATRSATFASYFARLRTDVQGEIEQFVNAFTVNETYFYREDHQLRCLTADLLAERLLVRSRGTPIRIWCAPCSTGEEPYSLAMWLLDTQVLEAARAGVFGKRALMRLSPHLIEKYFDRADVEKWKILDDLRASVQFSQVNIVESAQTRAFGHFDVIFCRNVLIYFDDTSRRVAAENLYENLLPGGFICLGHTESMSRISPLFEVRRFHDAIVYQRPNGVRAP
jgi:chemotaxis protein methyltransferase CheR